MSMSIEQRETDAFRDGRNACRAGYTTTDCPEGAAAAEWIAGWRHEAVERTRTIGALHLQKRIANER